MFGDAVKIVTDAKRETRVKALGRDPTNTE